MLTKNDLSQIRGIVGEEIEKRTRPIVREEIETRTRQIVQGETRKIVQEEIEPVKNEIKTIKKDIREIRSDIKAIISFFDREFINLLKRVERIEEHLGLQPLQ